MILGVYWVGPTQMVRNIQKQPRTIPPQRSPQWPSRRNKIITKNRSKIKISSETLIHMAEKAQRNQKSSKNASPKS